MYDFVDRPVTSLDHGGRFLIWSMRSWAKAVEEGRCPASAIGPAFAKWRMIDALAPFHCVMLALSREARFPILFLPLGCNHVAEHEAIILQLACALRMPSPQGLRDTLALIVAGDRMANIERSLVAIGAGMTQAGIFPSRPTGQPRRCPRD